MKLMIGDYEVEIKARHTGLSSRANKSDTLFFLNHIQLLARAASELYEAQGADCLAEEALNEAHGMYTTLSDLGFYKKH